MKVFCHTREGSKGEFDYRCPYCELWSVGSELQFNGRSPLTCPGCGMSQVIDLAGGAALPVDAKTLAFMKPIGNKNSALRMANAASSEVTEVVAAPGAYPDAAAVLDSARESAKPSPISRPQSSA